MKRISILIAVLTLSVSLFANESEQEQYAQWAQTTWDSMDRQTGEITLSEAGASLSISEEFYFLNAKDSATVLTEIWGNPPSDSVLGMIFPAHTTPFDGDSWAVTFEYEEDGYVSDKDAQDIDYSDLLKQMQKDTQEANEYRIENGYSTVELLGWAAEPFYNADSNKLYWAKELKFGNDQEHVLNYNIRMLGRKGVLVLNFIASLDQLPEIEQSLPTVLAIADFNDGSKYSDFNPEMDKVAGYGLGALVAGKVLAKTGILATILLFLKKFGVIAIIAIGAFFRKMLFRKKQA